MNEAFWQACRGGQFRAAQRLLERGPDLNYHPGYEGNSPIEIAAQVDTRRRQLVEWLQAHGPQPTPPQPGTSHNNTQ